MIYGDRIRLRAPEREDIPRFVAWLNDPEVIAGLTMIQPLSLAEEEKWFDNMLTRPSAEHPLTIEVADGQDWRPIGNIGLHEIDWRSRSAEIGIFIGDKKYWNQGFGTEAMMLLLKHAFLSLNLHRVYLRVHADNPRAIRSYEKAGYTHEGRFREAEYKNGHYVDVLILSVLRSEWKL